MAGFQFTHMETYSRKADAKGRSVSFVLREVAREPDACLHVERPGVPTVVHGVGPGEVAALHDEMVSTAGSTDKTGKRRAVRVDQHTLLTVIASHPTTSEDLRADSSKAAEVERWQALVVAWLRERHGDDLVSVVRHDDESHPHLHAYVLPRTASMKAREFHPGVVAKVEAVAAAAAAGDDTKVANRKGDRAYRAAMREWQDRYWQAVGLPCGQARLGPGKRSLSKAAWQAEQAQVERVAVLERRTEKAATVVGQGREVVASLRVQVAEAEAARDAAIAAAEAAKAEADAVVKAVRKEAAGLLSQARRQAAGIVKNAMEQAAHLVGQAQSVGAMLGAAVLSMVGQSPSKAAARGAEAEREAASMRESGLRGELAEVRRELRAFRRELAEARGLICSLATERDELRQVVSRSMPGMRIPLTSPPLL